MTLFCSIYFRIFASLLTRTSMIHNEKVRPQKLEMFGQLKSIKSCDPKLRESNEIRILEIGAGTGWLDYRIKS